MGGGDDGVPRKRLVELVVHDLRNPLAALLGNLELLHDELGEATPSVREGLDACTELATRALTLVATILDVAELEAGDLTVERRGVGLAGLVAQATARNAAGVRVRELRLEVEVAGDLVASLDPDLAERVLEHLLDNAIRYARRGGRVVISSSRHDGVLEIAIGNDGPPVPPAEREAIFGRHYKAQARRASAHRGLGLYFCKLAVEAHGGTLAVEERGDLGAVFVARLPGA
jgi:two-component system, OmpR family, heavy metal sensor histidine kinase CusS